MPYTYTVLGFMICEASIFAANNQMFLHVLVEKGLIPKPNIQNYFI